MSVCICQSSVLRVDSSADAESLGGHFVRDGLQTLQLCRTQTDIPFQLFKFIQFSITVSEVTKRHCPQLVKKDSFPHHKTVGRYFN